MAKHVLYDASLVVNAVDLSAHVESVSVVETLNDAGNAAGMGEIQDYNLAGTVKYSDVTVTFFQDYASNKVYAVLHAALVARSTINVVAKATTASASATNPQFTLPCFVKTLPIFSGTRGQTHKAQATFTIAGVVTISAP
jgi:hypothetical protein